MGTTWKVYALVGALGVPVAGHAAGDARGAEKAEPPPDSERALIGQDLAHPPPGTPEDQALWRSGHQVTQDVQIERARATRLQTVLLNLRYSERAQALAARPGADGERGAALQKRLGDAHAQQFSVLTAAWPIDTYRVCGYPAMELGSMMMYDGKAAPSDLAKHRAMLIGCVEQASASLKAMREGNDRLEVAMKAVDEAAPASAVAKPSPPAAGKGPAAAATRGDAGEREGRLEQHRHDVKGAEGR